MGNCSEIMPSSLRASRLRKTLLESSVMYVSWRISSDASEGEVQLKRRIVAPRILIPSLPAVYIFMVTGMRSLARILRRRTDFILAKQL